MPGSHEMQLLAMLENPNAPAQQICPVEALAEEK
jgi:hypothetical protein